MKKIYLAINELIIKSYWFIVLALGYLTGYSLFFLIFKKTDLSQFYVFNTLDTPRYYFIGSVGVVIILYLLIAFFYHQYFLKKGYQTILALAAIILNIILSFNSEICPQYLAIILLAASISFYFYPLIIVLSKKIENKKWILLSILFFFVISYSLICIMRNYTFNSSAFDLGIYTQAFYKYSHFQFSENTIRAIGNLWGDHFNPILIPLSIIFYRFYPSANLLLVIQAIIVVAAGIPLFLLAKDVLKNKTAAYFIVLAYLVFMGLQSAIYFDFHTITLAPTFYILAFYLAYKNNWQWYFVSLFLLLICKEDTSLFVVFLGLFLIYWKKNWKVGLATALIGIIWYMLATMVIIPHYSSSGFIYFAYDTLGKTPGEAVKNIITNPLHAWQALINFPEKQITLFIFACSFGFLFFLAPSFLFLAIPMLGENLWNDTPARWLGFHYGISPLPVFAIATIFAMVALSKFFNEKYRKNLIIILSFYVFICSLSIGFYQKMPLKRIFNPSFYKISSDVEDANKVIAFIPDKSSIDTQHSAVPHLANRNLIFPYPGQNWQTDKITDYYFFTLAGSSYPFTKAGEIQTIKDFLGRSDYGLIKRINGAFLFKKDKQTSPSDYDQAMEYLNNYEIK